MNQKQVSLRSIIIVNGSGDKFICEYKINMEDYIKQCEEIAQLCPDLFSLEYSKFLKDKYNCKNEFKKANLDD